MTTFRSRQRARPPSRLPQQRAPFKGTHRSSLFQDNTPLPLFAPCPRGLETILAHELSELGADQINLANGGVAFCGNGHLMMRANLMCRTASRILIQLAHNPYRTERDIYSLAIEVDWPYYFSAHQRIKVKTDAVHSPLKSLDYVSLIVKDAICDRFRQARHPRPSVDTRDPTIRIHVFLDKDNVKLYLDTSGDPLFKRGWRDETGEAPLRENLAAGILMLAGYTGEQALIDPMCGSGTFLIEAADIALRRAPGRLRDFAFQHFTHFEATCWEKIKAEAQQRERLNTSLPIRGSDSSANMVEIARATLERTGLRDVVTVEKHDIFAVRPHTPYGLIVTNPPYGVRMDEQCTLAALYPQLGDWLKQHFAGWTAHFITGDPQLTKLIRLTTKRRIPLFNGALECRLLVIPIIAGSARHKTTQPNLGCET